MPLDLVGQTFGRWAVLEKIPQPKKTKGRRYWRWCCRCSCGTVKNVRAQHLTEGRSLSCGCYHRERRAEIGRTHGDAGTRLYCIWQGMHQRCENPKNWSFRSYGARGIKVSPAWDTYEPFKSWSRSFGYSDELTLDRIDNEQGYCPDNCRWVLPVEQSKNKRNTIRVEINGESMCLKDACRILGLKYQTIYNRTHSGWPESRWFEPIKEVRRRAG